MKQITIKCEFAKTINLGNYENIRPCVSLEETISFDGDNEVIERQKTLDDMCVSLVNKHAKKAKLEQLAKDAKDIRFYDVNGYKYPSVTSIIGLDKTFPISDEDLSVYGARGTIIHAQVEDFIKTGRWNEPHEIKRVAKELKKVLTQEVTVSGKKKLLEMDNYNFQGYYLEHQAYYTDTELKLFNHDNQYAGTCDIVGEFNGLKTVFDVKTSGSIDKESFFMQLAAYAKCLEGVEQLCIIHLNRKNKCGYAAPVVTTEVDKYYDMFLDKVKVFNDRFGI